MFLQNQFFGRCDCEQQLLKAFQACWKRSALEESPPTNVEHHINLLMSNNCQNFKNVKNQILVMLCFLFTLIECLKGALCVPKTKVTHLVTE